VRRWWTQSIVDLRLSWIENTSAAVVVAATILTWPMTAQAQQAIVGVANVIDGDTIEIHGARIRFHGIDAPESRQECTRPNSATWRCGQQSAMALAERIGRWPRDWKLQMIARTNPEWRDLASGLKG